MLGSPLNQSLFNYSLLACGIPDTNQKMCGASCLLPRLDGREAVDGSTVSWHHVSDGAVVDSSVAILEEYAGHARVAAVGCQGYVAKGKLTEWIILYIAHCP